jgi:hypothetical protein
MADRELLEAAAKAAGPDVFKHSGGTWCQRYNNGSNVAPWNPLSDDGDALRLAVKLRMNVDILDEGSAAQIVYEHFGSEEPSNGDNYAATRRAIVRAAASIGAK